MPHTTEMSPSGLNPELQICQPFAFAYASFPGLAIRLHRKPHAAKLSHLGTREGVLRHLRELAQPVAHAGRNARLVLRQVLPRL
jgi:hypothetical protein